MKKLFTLFTLIVAMSTFAQPPAFFKDGIKTPSITTPTGYTKLDVNGGLSMHSTVAGFVPPPMTTAQKNAIVSPALGTLVTDTTLGPQYWNGTAWVTYSAGAGASTLQATTDALLVAGYAETTNGISASGLKAGGFFADGYSFGAVYDDQNITWIPFVGFVQSDSSNNSYFGSGSIGVYSNDNLYSSSLDLGSLSFKNNSGYLGVIQGNTSLTSDRVYTLPNKSGTFAMTSDVTSVTPSALTKTNDTNVTLTLGGTPGTALLQPASITVGWTGTLADNRIASSGTWNAKQAALGFTPENVANKSINVSTDGTSDVKYSTPKSVKTYVDAAVSGVTTPTLQQILNNNHGLVNGVNLQGGNAGGSQTGANVNAFGSSVAASNTANNFNGFGSTVGYLNTGSDFNGFGFEAGTYNTYNFINLFGKYAQADGDFQTVFSKSASVQQRFDFNNITGIRKVTWPDRNFTVAGTDEIQGNITGGNGLVFDYSDMSSPTVNINDLNNSTVHTTGDINSDANIIAIQSIIGNSVVVNNGTNKTVTIKADNVGNDRVQQLQDIDDTFAYLGDLNLKYDVSNPADYQTYSQVNSSLLSYELTANKQNDLTADGTGAKFGTVDAINNGLATKQATLVSGTNIKSISGTSLIGTGDTNLGDFSVNATTIRDQAISSAGNLKQNLYDLQGQINSMTNYRFATSSFTALNTDHFIVTGNSGVTLTLPNASTVPSGHEYVIKHEGGGTLTIVTTSSQTIDDAVISLSLTYKQAVTIRSAGPYGWLIISRY